MTLTLMDVVIWLSRWVHILAVITAVGGAIFMRMALLPAAAEALSDEQHDALRTAVVRRWKRLVHASIALLLITGSFNFYVTFGDGVSPIPYHPIFGVKVLAAFTIFFLASALVGSSPGFAKLRRESGKWLGVIIGLGVIIVMLSGVLKAVHQAALSASAG